MERSRKDFVNKRQIGNFYEEAVCNYLIENGITVIERNYRCKVGEIDIIGKDNECYIFFEVKYRETNRFGSTLDAVDLKKQRKICRCASIYCMQHPWILQIRYDVIGINNTKIDWIQNAFMHIGHAFL